MHGSGYGHVLRAGHEEDTARGRLGVVPLLRRVYLPFGYDWLLKKLAGGSCGIAWLVECTRSNDMAAV